MKKLCLHLGCGTVYLSHHDPDIEVVNIDVSKKGVTLFAADIDKSIMDKHKTFFDNYYGKQTIQNNLGFNIVDIVCNINNSERLKSIIDGKEVKEIICLQTLEHFSEKEVPEILKTFYDILQIEGKLIISVPDMPGTCELLMNTVDIYKTHDKLNLGNEQNDIDYVYRLIYGSQNNEFAFHKSAFDNKKLNALLKNTGFKNIEYLENMHDYPALVVTAYKW